MTMTKEEAIKLIDTHTVCFYNEIDSPTLQALHLAIEALLTKPKTGKWVEDGCVTKCNICGEVKEFPHWNFCPNCGAVMRKGDQK